MEEQEKLPAGLPGYPEWHKKPFRLSRQEMATPITVIGDYFQSFHLDDVRERFKDFFSDALQADEPRPDHHLYFQEETEKCIEAAYCLHEQGIVPLNSERQKKRRDFLYNYLDEIDGLLFKVKVLLQETQACKDQEKDTYSAEVEQRLEKMEILITQLESAQSSMMTMVSDDDGQVNTSSTPERNITTITIDRLIHDAAAPYNSYQPTFNKSLSVRIDPLVPSTISYYSVDLEVLIDTLLDTAFILCSEGGSVSLVCNSQPDAIGITVSADIRISGTTEKGNFPPYELFADSTIAGAHLYISDQIARGMGASLRYWSSGIRTHFTVVAPLQVS